MRHLRVYLGAALGLAVVSLFLIAVVQPVVQSTGTLSPLNRQEEGASAFAEELAAAGPVRASFAQALGAGDVLLAQDTILLPVDPSRTTLLIIGPERPPTTPEARWLAAFVRDGGRLVLADDFGTGNVFLEASGAGMRLTRKPVHDLVYQEATTRVVSEGLREPPEGWPAWNVEEVVLQSPTSILPGNLTVVAARTGETSWETAALGLPTGPNGPHAWLATERVGRGEVVLVADATVFSNAMRPHADNAALVSAVAGWAAEDGRVLVIDTAHTARPGAGQVLSAGLRALPLWLRTTFALAALAVPVIASMQTPTRWILALRDKVVASYQRIVAVDARDDEALVAQALRKHPEWDESALRRILAGWRRP